MTLYFAYGSNMGPSIFALRCPSARFVGTAVLDGFRVAFTRYSKRRRGGVADVIAARNAQAWGALYELTDDDFDRLDVFEGTPHAYRRAAYQVRTQRGEVVTAWIYTVVSKAADVVPSQSYWRLLVEGAAEAGLPAEYRAMLEAIPLGD